MTLYGAPAKLAIGFSASSPACYPNSDWPTDTCASYHLYPDLSAFVAYAPIDQNHLQPSDYIRNVNGERTACQGVGTVLINIGEGTMVLNNTRYNPHIDANLISVGSLAKRAPVLLQAFRDAAHTNAEQVLQGNEMARGALRRSFYRFRLTQYPAWLPSTTCWESRTILFGQVSR
jgi:hypothetical protein